MIILRILIVFIVTISALFIDTLMTRLMDSWYTNMIDQTVMTAVGWSDPVATMIFWLHLGVIGIPIIVITWMITAPLKDDIRQSQFRL